MIVVWRPPGALIVLGNFAVVVFGFGYLLTQVMPVLPPGDHTGGILFSICGLTIVISDVLFRRSQRLALLSLAASTWFFVIPSWAVGLGLAGYGLHLLGTG